MWPALGPRKQDVFINLVEVPKENWSFGNGKTQYGPQQHGGDTSNRLLRGQCPDALVSY